MMCILFQLIKRGSIRSRPWVQAFHFPRKKNYPSKSKQTKRKTLLRDSPGWWVLFFFFVLFSQNSSVSCNFGICRIHSIFHATHLFHLNPKSMRCLSVSEECVVSDPCWRSQTVLENVRDRDHQMGILRPRE